MVSEEFGKDNVYHDEYYPSGGIYDFPVICNNKKIESALNVSEALNNIPIVKIDYVYIKPEIIDEAVGWLEEYKKEILEGGRIEK